MKTENKACQTSIQRQRKQRSKKKRRYRNVLRAIVFAGCVFIASHIGYMAGADIGYMAGAESQSAGEQVEKSISIIMQNPILPNGCEAVSMTMLMRGYGIEADAAALAMDYIPRGKIFYSGNTRYGPNPENCYIGDPSSSRNGWYCFEQPLIQGTNCYLRDLGSNLKAKSITGTSFVKLMQYVKSGVPVIVWLTTDYNEPRYNVESAWILPDGSEYFPYQNLHCVVITKVENTEVRIADPLQGEITITEDLCEKLYEQMNERAVILDWDFE